MLHSNEPWRAPLTYGEARAWLDARDGVFLVTRDDEADCVLVVVGVHGRSAQVVSASHEAKDLEAAFLSAVAKLRMKL